MIFKLSSNKQQIVSIFIVAVFLSGCFGGGKNIQKQLAEPPHWITNPQQDNDSYYFGVGEGRSIEASKLSALKEVSSKLSVIVSGSTELNSTLRNDDFYETASINIK